MFQVFIFMAIVAGTRPFCLLRLFLQLGEQVPAQFTVKAPLTCSKPWQFAFSSPSQIYVKHFQRGSSGDKAAAALSDHAKGCGFV